MGKILTCPEMDLPSIWQVFCVRPGTCCVAVSYARAIAEGDPCFSVREIAERNADPSLVSLLASRQVKEPSIDDLTECVSRLEAIVGSLPMNPHGSLEALVVNEWYSGGDLLAMAFMALGIAGGESDYAEVDKILL